ncbi:MAG: hypothetical protein D6698_15885 [Gammaproteobacteria bacterium]|nr:MAG: hypothetical protein D6698_15885 [Gammaproteobacteria bacterium]
MHLNHVFYPHPFQSFHSAEARCLDLRKYLVRPSFRSRVRQLLRMREKLPSNTPDGPYTNWAFDRQKLAKSPWDWLIVSWENKFLYDHAVQRYFFRKEQYVADEARYVQLLILRDPYNHFASLKKSGRLEGHGLALYTALWKQYAREFLRPTFLPDPVLRINYNQWVVDAEYRIRLAREIGFETDGKAYGKTPGYGGGSSFEGKRDVSPRGVLERWRVYENDPSFRSIFDDDMMRWGEEIFGISRPF